MKIFKFILSIILTILSCFFVIKCNDGSSIFTLLILLLMSIPFYLLYKDKRKNKIYTIIVSTIVLFLMVYILSNTIDIVSSYGVYLGNAEDSINYSYTKVSFSFEILFMFLYFISLFLNLFITCNNFIKDKSNNKIDVLSCIIFLLNIIIYLNAYFSSKLPEITKYLDIYHNMNYVSQFYGFFAIMFICIILYNKINSQD